MTYIYIYIYLIMPNLQILNEKRLFVIEAIDNILLRTFSKSHKYITYIFIFEST